jgi:hypothetical protein
MKSVIIYGPQGCGKTRNAAMLMRYFGLKRVIEEYHYGKFPLHGALVLLNARPHIDDARRIYSYDEIMQIISDGKKPPSLRERTSSPAS